MVNTLTINEMSLVQVTSDVTLSNVTLFNIFKLYVNFDKFIVRLHYIHIFFMLAKF